MPELFLQLFTERKALSDEIENFLLENCINGDLLITMGAGDVVKIGENLLGK